MTTFKRYLIIQKKLIELDKWFEGIRIHGDPGKKYIFEWIEKNAENFNINWHKSLCCKCLNWERCGFKLLINCNEYNKI